MPTIRTAVLSLVAAAATAVPATAAGAVPPLSPVGDCSAYALSPSAMHSFATSARGGFVCGTPGNLSVEVCLEVFTGTWVPIACETGYEPAGTSVTAEAFGCEWGLYVYRSVAVGTAHDTGETASAESLPVAFYCTPL